MKQKLREHLSFSVILVISFLFSMTNFSHAQTTQVMGEFEAYENVINVKIDRQDVDRSVSREQMQNQALSGVASIDQLNVSLNAVQMEPVFKTDPRFAERHRRYGLDQWYKIHFENQEDVDRLLREYEALAEVEIAEPIFVREHTKSILDDYAPAEVRETLLEDPDDPQFGDQWHYFNNGQTEGTAGSDLNLSPAWEQETGSSDVIVQVVDSGIDEDHEDLENMLWINPNPGPENGFDGDLYGWNFASDNDNITDIDGHGSHVSGTVAAESNNTMGVSGVAGGNGTGDGVRIMVARTFDDHEDVVGGFPASFIYGADNGAVISQNSWGGGGFSQVLNDAMQYFIDNAGYDAEGNVVGPIAGGVIIFAAGNANNDVNTEPVVSNPEKVISVAATSHNDTKAWYSTYGDWVDVSAPGGETTDPDFNPIAGGTQGILSTTPNNNYSYYQGSSMACPHVSGVAALIASRFNGISREEVIDRIVLTTRDFNNDLGSFDGLMGVGVVDANAAIQESDGTPPAPIADLEVDGDPGPISVDLTWTATGLSGTEGQALEYDLRYSVNPIEENNFDEAEQVTNIPSPLPAGETENFTVTGLEPETTYYFAIKASHFLNGTSDISNVVNTTTDGVPVLALNPDELIAILDAGEVQTETVLVSNTGEGTLNFSFPAFAVQNVLGRAGVVENNFTKQYDGISLRKGEEDYRVGHPVLIGAGGPDEFGYSWLDSNEEEGPAFNWVDISEIGDNLSDAEGEWDGNQTVQLPFDFPFYGEVYNEMVVSINGWINFDGYSDEGFNNVEIPTGTDPNALLAVMWDDNDARESGELLTYYDEENSRFIIQWDEMPSSEFEEADPGEHTFQAILGEDGNIIYQYLDVSGDTETNTVGIESPDGTDGLQVAFNTEYVQNNLAVTFNTVPEWISSVSPASGSLTPGESLDVDIEFDATDLPPLYSDQGQLFIESNDIVSPTQSINVGVETTEFGGTPELVVNPAEVDFGDVYIGFPVTETILIENDGNATMTVSDISLAGDADYGLVSDLTLPVEIAPGSSVAVDVTFDPEDPGVQTATLNVDSDGSDAIAEVPFTAAAFDPPVAVLSEENITSSITGEGTDDQELTITNDGPGELEFEIEDPELDYLTLSATTGVVEANEDTTITFSFSAAELTEGTYSADVTIRTNDPANLVFDISTELEVVGIPELITAETEFDLGSAEIGSSVPGAVRIYNEGNGTLTISEITIENGEFTTSTESLTVEPNDSEAFIVRFAPQEIGERTSELTLVSNDSDSPAELTLTGSGTEALLPPVAVVSESAFTPEVTTGEAGEESFAVQNDGDEILEATISIIEGSPEDESTNDTHTVPWLAADKTELSIDPSESDTVSLNIDTEGLFAGSYNAVILLDTNDPETEQLAITLDLTVEAADPARVQLIHNSPDPALGDISIYINGDQAIESLVYRSATEFVDVPSRVENQIELFLPDDAEEAVYSTDLTFEENSSYVLIASGVAGEGFAPNPDVDDISFWVELIEDVPQTAEEGNTQLAFYQGVTDSPGFDLSISGVEEPVSDVTFGTIVPYTEYSASETDFDLTIGEEQLARGFRSDLSAGDGQGAVALFSGFYDPEDNPSESTFDMLVVFQNGTVQEADLVTSMEDEPIPIEFDLSHNYPNPFNPTTQIDFALPQAQMVKLQVFDLLGRRVAELVNEERAAGTHNVTFDASQYSSGVYLYRIEAGSFTQTRQMMLIK